MIPVDISILPSIYIYNYSYQSDSVMTVDSAPENERSALRSTPDLSLTIVKIISSRKLVSSIEW